MEDKKPLGAALDRVQGATPDPLGLGRDLQAAVPATPVVCNDGEVCSGAGEKAAFG